MNESENQSYNTVYIEKNMQFLLSATGLSIEQFAEFASASLDFFSIKKMAQFERIGQDAAFLIPICNYFDVLLGDMVFTDLESAGKIDPGWFEKLKMEAESGVPCYRPNTDIYQYKSEEKDGQLTDLEFSKKLLNQKQQLGNLKKVYNHFRRKGAIDEINWFEED